MVFLTGTEVVSALTIVKVRSSVAFKSLTTKVCVSPSAAGNRPALSASTLLLSTIASPSIEMISAPRDRLLSEAGELGSL